MKYLLILILPFLLSPSQAVFFKAKPTKDDVKIIKQNLPKGWHIIRFKFKGIEV